MVEKYHNARKEYSNYNGKGFVTRIGKYCGLEYMVGETRNMKNSYGKEVATHTLYEVGNAPFGWMAFELIGDEEYRKQLQEIKKSEADYYRERSHRQKGLKDSIKKAKQEAEEKELQKQRAKEEAKRREEEEQKAKEAYLAKLTPLERKVEEIKEQDTSGAALSVLIFNALKSGELDEGDKKEALELIRSKMKEEGTWKDKSKKPEKDKKYKRTLEVKEMLEAL